jgi:hypothetical protein
MNETVCLVYRLNFYDTSLNNVERDRGLSAAEDPTTSSPSPLFDIASALSMFGLHVGFNGDDSGVIFKGEVVS